MVRFAIVAGVLFVITAALVYAATREGVEL